MIYRIGRTWMLNVFGKSDLLQKYIVLAEATLNPTAMDKPFPVEYNETLYTALSHHALALTTKSLVKAVIQWASIEDHFQQRFR